MKALKLKKKDIMDEIRLEYERIKTLSIQSIPYDDGIEIIGMEYKSDKGNNATEEQVNFLLSMDNVFGYHDNLLKANKWFMDACIKIAKKYYYQNFEINIS